MNIKPAVQIKHLTKIYSASQNGEKVVAVKDLNLEIKEGEIFALLGPNGAGKSTTIGILVGLVNKTSGEARVFGYDVERDYKITRHLIGVVPQELNFDPFFNVRKVLEYQSGFFGVPKDKWRVNEILKRLHLAEHDRKNVRQLSGGLKRRLMVAKALVHNPRLLILDEPTAGVDVELRRELWDYVRELRSRGTTIILTTHYLEEAEQMADRIGIIDKGELKALDTLDNLRQTFSYQKLEDIFLYLTK